MLTKSVVRRRCWSQADNYLESMRLKLSLAEAFGLLLFETKWVTALHLPGDTDSLILVFVVIPSWTVRKTKPLPRARSVNHQFAVSNTPDHFNITPLHSSLPQLGSDSLERDHAPAAGRRWTGVWQARPFVCGSWHAVGRSHATPNDAERKLDTCRALRVHLPRISSGVFKEVRSDRWRPQLILRLYLWEDLRNANADDLRHRLSRPDSWSSRTPIRAHAQEHLVRWTSNSFPSCLRSVLCTPCTIPDKSSV